MLGTTKEFSKFAQIADDNGMNVRYMDPLKQKEGCHYPKKRDPLKSFDFNAKSEDEFSEEWVPAEAF